MRIKFNYWIRGETRGASERAVKGEEEKIQEMQKEKEKSKLPPLYPKPHTLLPPPIWYNCKLSQKRPVKNRQVYLSLAKKRGNHG